MLPQISRMKVLNTSLNNEFPQRFQHIINTNNEHQGRQVLSTKECKSCLKLKTVTEFSGKQWNANAQHRRCISCLGKQS